MSLTHSSAPLATAPSGSANYRIEGPGHLLFLDAFPRRVRAEFAGRTVVDTLHGMLLHETDQLPQLYVPQTETPGELLEPSGRTTHCPYKGRARFASLVVDGETARDAVWSYPDPAPGALWLRGYHGIAFAAMDAWYDENEQVFGHLRDPYHRVDVRPTDRRVRVSLGREVLAETGHAVLVSETGLPNRLYIAPQDVREGALVPGDTTTVCPYKGTARYADAAGISDAAWCYPDPLPEVAALAGHWCFDEDKVGVAADSRTAPSGPGQRRRIVEPGWL